MYYKYELDKMNFFQFCIKIELKIIKNNKK